MAKSARKCGSARIPREAGFAAGEHEVLRFRNRFASRNGYCSQEDNLILDDSSGMPGKKRGAEAPQVMRQRRCFI